jgi:hypothetical protein
MSYITPTTITVYKKIFDVLNIKKNKNIKENKNRKILK